MFELGVESGFEISQYIVVTLEKNNINHQANNYSIINEMVVTERFCRNGNVTYAYDRMTISYGANNHNVACEEILNFNRNYNGLLDSIKPHVNHRAFKIYYRVYI